LVVRDTAHAINGGLCIDESSQSTLLGLFAAGEVAAGAHGADRLGGGMVTNCQVFGARAGRFAAAWAQQASGGELGDADLAAPLARWHSFGRAGRDAEEVLGALQRVAGRNLMVVRNAAGLHEVLDTIQELRRDGLPQVGVGNLAALRRAMEVENCLLTAELMASAALERRESRGSHYREDFPQRDDTQWGRNILHRLDAGELTSVSGELSKVP
jgi:L-aspartate oxidase